MSSNHQSLRAEVEATLNSLVGETDTENKSLLVQLERERDEYKEQNRALLARQTQQAPNPNSPDVPVDSDVQHLRRQFTLLVQINNHLRQKQVGLQVRLNEALDENGRLKGQLFVNGSLEASSQVPGKYALVDLRRTPRFHITFDTRLVC